MGLPKLTRNNNRRVNRRVLVPRRARSLLVQFTALFIAAGAVIWAAAGFTLSAYLTSSDPLTDATVQRSVFTAVGSSLAALYFVLVLLVWRASSTIRRHESGTDVRLRQMKANYDSVVAIMAAALDLQDNVTQGQARRVAELASTLGWQLGLRKEQVRQIQKATILHDIGKIGVADAVLSKAGPLDDNEWEDMKRHPELGYEIVKDLEFMRDAADVIHAHHERWDGTGYPRSLKGEEIPVGARIFAVVDAYEAMTSHRPYRKALSHESAFAEIIRSSGTQFDPEVVRAFREAESRGLVEGGNGHQEGAPELPTMYRHPEELPTVYTDSDPEQEPQGTALPTAEGS